MEEASYCPYCGSPIQQINKLRNHALIDYSDLNELVDLLKRNAKKVNNGKDHYKGTVPGYRLYIYDNKGMSLGMQNDNAERDGINIYIVSPHYPENHINNCQDARFFVGSFHNNIKSKIGTCYDKDGNLIYDGMFVDDKPTGNYPSKEGYSSYRFELIKYPDGSCYLGETKDRKRHGQGIFIWTTGSCWYGKWDDGTRKGEGIFIWYTGDYSIGKWD